MWPLEKAHPAKPLMPRGLYCCSSACGHMGGFTPQGILGATWEQIELSFCKIIQSLLSIFLQIKLCCLEIRSGRVILFVGMMFVRVSEGSRAVLVLCCSLGGEECFISMSRVGGGLCTFPTSKLAVWTRSFSHEKQNKSPNLWDCLRFPPSDSKHLGRETSPNPGMTLEPVALKSALIYHLSGCPRGSSRWTAGKPFPGHPRIPVNLKSLPMLLES